MKIGGIKIEDRRDKDIQQTENSIESPRNISKKRLNCSKLLLEPKRKFHWSQVGILQTCSKTKHSS